MSYLKPDEIICPKDKSNGRVMLCNNVLGLMQDGGLDHAPSVTLASFEDDPSKERNMVGIRRNGHGEEGSSTYYGWPKREKNPEWLLFEISSLDLLINQLTRLREELIHRDLLTEGEIINEK